MGLVLKGEFSGNELIKRLPSISNRHMLLFDQDFVLED